MLVLASGLTGPRALAVSGTSLFFSEGSAEDDIGVFAASSINGDRRSRLSTT